MTGDGNDTIANTGSGNDRIVIGARGAAFTGLNFADDNSSDDTGSMGHHL